MNKIDICFNLIDIYRNTMLSKMKNEGISDINATYIIDGLTRKNDIIFSLIRNYKIGSDFTEFCSKNNLSKMIAEKMPNIKSLYVQQERAIENIIKNKTTIISTGTGSGKTETFFIPIFDHCLKNINQTGVKAIIIYPMNALANDQIGRFQRYVKDTNIKVETLIGETDNNEREDIYKNHPDILITNYVMLDRLIVNDDKKRLFSDRCLKYVVVDELHSYNGNKALHIKYLLNRLRSKTTKDIVNIGCSATLSRDSSGRRTDGGYIENQYYEHNIKNFITSLFSVEDFYYAEPIYEREPQTNDYQDDGYNALAKSETTVVIRNALSNESKTSTELINILNSAGHKIDKLGLCKHFSKIADANKKNISHPILDFRVHLFFLEVGDNIRRCISCNTYYTSKLEICPDCSGLIFPIYSKETSLLVGSLQINTQNILFQNRKHDSVKVSIKPYLDNSDKYIVLIDIIGKSRIYDKYIEFDEYSISSNNGIEIIPKTGGKYAIYPIMPEKHKYTISLNYNQKYITIFNTLIETLKKLDANEKKILSFIDKRESCARYGVIGGDIILSKFFFEVIKFYNKTSHSLETLIEECNNQFEDIIYKYVKKKGLDEYQRRKLLTDIMSSFFVWIRRNLVTDRYNYFNEQLTLAPYQEHTILSDISKDIFTIMLREGAVFSTCASLNKSVITRLGFIYVKKTKTVALNAKTGGIALSKAGVKYDIGKIYSENELTNSLKELESKDLIKNIVSTDDIQESAFIANAKYISVKTAPSSFNSIDDIIEETLFFTGIHSSEVEKELKKVTENKFKASQINALFSTPTLEMGIDIGELNFVSMIGVPPTPSQYAQRIGRAGRRSERFAGIITFCNEASTHDWYYYNNPKEMIEGTILPPNFKENRNILNKHINTYLYHNLDKDTEEFYNKLTCIFPQVKDYNFHKKLLLKLLDNNKLGKNEPQNKLYEVGVYPDYSFSRDEIIFVDSIDVKEKLTSRDPVMGIREVVPTLKMFIGSEHYEINLPEDARQLKSFKIDNDNEFLDCSKLICTTSNEDIKTSRDNCEKGINIIIPNVDKSEKSYSKGPLTISCKLNTKIGLRCEYNTKEKKYSVIHNIGYDLCYKDMLIFKFDNNVMNKGQIFSFFAAFEITVRHYYGIDTGEIGNIYDNITPNTADDSDGSYYYMVMYDRTGSKNIDIENILDNCYELFEASLKRLVACSCQQESGCYKCLKSYNSQWYATDIKKTTAISFLRYLCGKAKFSPKLMFINEIISFNHNIDIRSNNNNILFKHNSDDYIAPNMSKQNLTITTEILKIFEAIKYSDNIKISSNITYLIKALKGENKLDGFEKEVNYLYFLMLSFKYAVIEKPS